MLTMRTELPWVMRFRMAESMLTPPLWTRSVKQLYDTLAEAMNALPEMERAVLERRYFRAEGRSEIALSLGLPDTATVTRREQSGLEYLSRGAYGRALEAFLCDETDPYHGVSYAAFAQSGASSVENTVFRREQLRWKLPQ